MGKKKEYRFTLNPFKQCEFWRGAVTGAMWSFGRTLPDGESFRWWWGYENGQQSWTCKVECDAKMFEKIKEYIVDAIPRGNDGVFDLSMTD